VELEAELGVPVDSCFRDSDEERVLKAITLYRNHTDTHTGKTRVGSFLGPSLDNLLRTPFLSRYIFVINNFASKTFHLIFILLLNG